MREPQEFRTDYWVSQERKYCEFCKCYVSGNKPSIDFHENGKNHRDNVAKRITMLQKKATKNAKEAEKHDAEMKKIETAALKSYAKDVEENPDLSSNTFDEDEYAELLKLPKKITLDNSDNFKFLPYLDDVDLTKIEFPNVKWVETWGDDGERFFWNVDTKQTLFRKPDEPFLTLEQQLRCIIPRDVASRAKAAKAMESVDQRKEKMERLKQRQKQKGKQREREEVYNEGSKKAGDFTMRMITDEDDLKYVPGYPYGKWEAIPMEPEKPKDLQLPLSHKEPAKVQIPEMEEIYNTKFQEKKISIPGSIPSTSGETAFKKRKIATDTKANIRRRTKDD